ncbi:MAG: hypothetical protein RJA07_364 [Bacteroidota bacterium]|jgi:uncharacterized protein YecT (DUF1311 family)
MKRILSLIVFVFVINQFALSQTQSEMNANAESHYKKVDSELNSVYQQLMKLQDGERKKGLIEIEKLWLKYRDMHCKFASATYELGSIYPVIYYTCLEEMTEKRIAELKNILEDYKR